MTRRCGTDFAARVEKLLHARRSVRAFEATRVPRATVEALLSAARSAPSGANLQPGRFHVRTGSALNDLTEGILREIRAGRPEVSEYSYFPDPMPAELKQRQRAAGYALYEAVGVERRDLAARRAQFERNYRFFDAPVGIVITIDRRMGKGCFMDLGMSLMALMTAAEARGLATCGIGALAKHGDVVAEVLGLPDEEMVVCGVALGWADRSAAVNSVRTERMPVDQFATFSGFED